MILYYVLIIAMYVLNAVAFMKLARIAGRPEIGWMAWVPILNLIQQLLLIRKSGWWVLMYLVPIANIVFAIVWQVKLLNAFGKSGAYVLLGIFLGPVYSILWIVWGLSPKTRYMLGTDGTVSSRTTQKYRRNVDDTNPLDPFDNDPFGNMLVAEAVTGAVVDAVENNSYDDNDTDSFDFSD